MVSSSILMLAMGCAAAGTALGLFTTQVHVRVINDGPHPVSLTCLWDNRGYLPSAGRTTLPVDSGSVEDCEVEDLHDNGYLGCLVLDARGKLASPHDIRISAALPDTATRNCSV